MQQETIQYKQSKQGTIVKYFSNAYNIQTNPDSIPAFLLQDLIGTPIKITESLDDLTYKKNQRNNYEFDNTIKYSTGRTITQKVESTIDIVRQGSIRTRFIDDMSRITLSNNEKVVSAVFFENTLVDDIFVDISIFKSYDILNTLSVHNLVKGEIPLRESPTGVLFGKLEAIQKLVGEDGKRINIPLRNVPVIIFNDSQEFPSISSVDDEGNRIRLNIKENSTVDNYFNPESFSADTSFLKDESVFANIPDKFKYSSITNENGEFLITDIPTGSRVLLFEVDLFKQGLTKDEVALNFFAYPTSENPQIDTVPHYSFQQIPVNIVPSWGDFQSGYTQINIKANLDLRKWTTYYFPPICSGDKNIEDLLKTKNTPLTIEVRDMSKEGFPLSNIQVVEVVEPLEKSLNQQLEWNGESIQVKSKVQFRKNDYSIFKLPANIYDPDGFKTDKEGMPTKHKGVWLASYQLKAYYDKPDTIFRTTGLERQYAPNLTITRDHFHLNRGNLDFTQKNTSKIISKIGTFPYEKPWSVSYPTRYSIPRKPSKEIPKSFITYDSGGKVKPTNQPKYSDGDLVGFLTDNKSGGFAIQVYPPNQSYLRNNFASRITRGLLYKYESNVTWQESYASGYNPILDNKYLSNVINGEQYQRLECGYGYWLKPEGWPLVNQNKWGDTMEQRYLTNDSVDSGNGERFNMSVKNFNEKDLELIMDYSSILKEGGIDIFRVIDATDISDPKPETIPTFATLEFQSIYVQRGSTDGFLNKTYRLKTVIYNSTTDNGNDETFWSYESALSSGSLDFFQIEITNNGNAEVNIEFNGNNKHFNIGETKNFDAKLMGDNFKLKLPGNYDLSPDETVYENINYKIQFKNIRFIRLKGTNDYEDTSGLVSIPINSGNPIILKAGFENDNVTYFLITKLESFLTTYFYPAFESLVLPNIDAGCKKDILNPLNPAYSLLKDYYIHSIKVNGMVFINSKNEGGGWFISANFESNKIIPSCDGSGFNGFGDSGTLIPFRAIV